MNSAVTEVEEKECPHRQKAKLHKPYLLLKLSKESYQDPTFILSFCILSYVFYITVTAFHPIMKFVCGSHPSIRFGKRNETVFLPSEKKTTRRKQTPSISTKPAYHKQEHIGITEKINYSVK